MELPSAAGPCGCPTSFETSIFMLFTSCLPVGALGVEDTEEGLPGLLDFESSLKWMSHELWPPIYTDSGWPHE